MGSTRIWPARIWAARIRPARIRPTRIRPTRIGAAGIRYRRQRQRHGQPAARGLLRVQRAAHGLGGPAGEGEAKPDAGGVIGVAQPLERHEHPVVLGPGDARPPVHHAELDPEETPGGGLTMTLSLPAVPDPGGPDPGTPGRLVE